MAAVAAHLLSLPAAELQAHVGQRYPLTGPVAVSMDNLVHSLSRIFCRYFVFLPEGHKKTASLSPMFRESESILVFPLVGPVRRGRMPCF